MIKYVESADEIQPHQLEGFFVAWPDPPTPATHLRLLRESAHVVLAIDDRSNHCVGFVTAISDGVLSAYIPLLEVLPAHQKQGIGTHLMRKMLAKLQGHYMIDLICDEGLQAYYKQLGMKEATGMMIRDYRAQAGTIEV